MRDARRLTLPSSSPSGPPREEPDRDPLDSGAAAAAGAGRPSRRSACSVRELDRTFVGRLDVPDSVQGVIVSRVDPTGAAFSAPIRRGFVIMEINRKPIRSVADYQRIIVRGQGRATCSRSTTTIRRSPSARS